ncbi:hypothetical protein ACP70R_042753 [Stipagrostis hirtigluma subsp. patula]
MSYQDYFGKWEQHGTLDLKQELAKLLMLISGRCLLGQVVRGKMFDEVFRSFDELFDNGICA